MEIKRIKIHELQHEITAETILFFDLDGTLIDTNLANFLSYKKAINTILKTNNYLEFDPRKRLNRSNLKTIIPNKSESEYEKIIHEKEENYKEFLTETKINKEILEILIKYHNKNQTFLVSNCNIKRAIMTLNHFKIHEYFTAIFCQYKQIKTRNKFKTAINKLKISPENVILFEDEEIEIANAKIAGIYKIVEINNI